MKKRKQAAARKIKAKAKKTKTTRPKKQAKKTLKKSTAKKERREIKTSQPALFEEILLNCVNCGKQMRLIKVPEFDPSGTLCSSCSKGEIELPQG